MFNILPMHYKKTGFYFVVMSHKPTILFAKSRKLPDTII
ncbi:hypothetical protein BN1221_03070c [Brenneria goodwinii]|uniref:Uncharacterized protein n=1 Tax=Brenneria goodwinii TaxID=1109412 RepID=A0A0G4JXJ7_9GAMM|nr:hypothetical protein BN1221_03070c [Brenneria goodwinii]